MPRLRCGIRKLGSSWRPSTVTAVALAAFGSHKMERGSTQPAQTENCEAGTRRPWLASRRLQAKIYQPSGIPALGAGLIRFAVTLGSHLGGNAVMNQIRANTQPSTEGRNGFTLMELLVVIAILLILAGLLFSSLANSMETAKSTACRLNQKQINLSYLTAVADAKGRFDLHNEIDNWFNGEYGRLGRPLDLSRRSYYFGTRSGPSTKHVSQRSLRNSQVSADNG